VDVYNFSMEDFVIVSTLSTVPPNEKENGSSNRILTITIESAFKPSSFKTPPYLSAIPITNSSPVPKVKEDDTSRTETHSPFPEEEEEEEEEERIIVFPAPQTKADPRAIHQETQIDLVPTPASVFETSASVSEVSLTPRSSKHSQFTPRQQLRYRTPMTALRHRPPFTTPHTRQNPVVVKRRTPDKFTKSRRRPGDSEPIAPHEPIPKRSSDLSEFLLIRREQGTEVLFA
jgi:hypothetical protein